MPFIYHLVPEDMRGEELVPLAELRSLWPDLHQREIKKYDDHPQRKMLPQRILKKLNCPQAEVLHFSPIHPRLMFEGLKSVFPDWDHPSKFFEIPIERLRGLPSVMFDMNCTGRYIFGEDEPEEMFDWVTPESYQILTEIPREALEFYRSWREQGRRGAPAMARIPHVMVRGRVNVQDCRTLDWREPIRGAAGYSADREL